MFKRYSIEFAIVTAGLISSATSFLNNERYISITKTETDKYIALESKVSAVSNELKFDAQSIVEPISYEDLDSSLSLNSFSGYLPDFSSVPSDVLHPFCVSIFLFSFVGLISALSVVANLISLHISNKIGEKAPSWMLPFINFKTNYVFYSNTTYIVLIIFAQTSMMALATFHYFN